MKKKISIIIAIILIVLVILIFFIKKNYKFSNNGNNMSNKSADEIKNYILNMDSFSAEASVTITSNKTTNTYVFNQKFKGNQYSQELLEPNNIAGLKIQYDGANIKVENTKIGLSKLYEDYKYITNNSLCINTFCDNYKNEANEKTMYEENDTIVLETKIKNENIYNTNKKLYIDKKTAKPVKMEIQDITQNLKVYILYNKVEINTLQEENIIAFNINKINDIV